MTKILLGVLTLAAFLYAVWLVILRRHLPDPQSATGWRRRFRLGTILFAGFLGGVLLQGGCAASNGSADGAVEADGEEVEVKGVPLFVETVRDVWQQLLEKDAPAFGEATGGAAETGLLRRQDASMLRLAFERLSFHKRATRGGNRILCYLPSHIGNIEYTSAETALKQIELLRDLKEKGTVDRKTAEKAHATLARELETTHTARSLRGYEARFFSQRFIDDYKAGRIEAGDVALVAAATILELEGVARPKSSSPAVRLQTMRERVETLLREGPFRNDWKDSTLRPNVQELLKNSGVLTVKPPATQYITCYLVSAPPMVKERSEELKRLQEKLLDEQVEAGVLDVEAAERIRKANEKDDTPDFATETDIRAYQKKVRRVVRLLYRRGEVPPSFVRELEHAIAMEIIAFDPAKARRDEMRWHLRSVLRTSLGDAVLDALVERKLIPPAQNHRLAMIRHGSEPGLSAGDRERLQGILALIDGDEPIHLDRDGNSTIHNVLIPQTDREYILTMRRVVRALHKANVIQTDEALQRFGEILKLEVVGRLQSEPPPP